LTTLFDTDDTNNQKYHVLKCQDAPADVVIIKPNNQDEVKYNIEFAPGIALQQKVFVMGWNVWGVEHPEVDYGESNQLPIGHGDVCYIDHSGITFSVSILGKKGSSGSAVVTENGELLGVVNGGWSTCVLTCVRCDRSSRIKDFLENPNKNGVAHYLFPKGFGKASSSYLKAIVWYGDKHPPKFEPVEQFDDLIKLENIHSPQQSPEIEYIEPSGWQMF